MANPLLLFASEQNKHFQNKVFGILNKTRVTKIMKKFLSNDIKRFNCGHIIVYLKN